MVSKEILNNYVGRNDSFGKHIGKRRNARRGADGDARFAQDLWRRRG
jgi:hypothetical protein